MITGLLILSSMLQPSNGQSCSGRDWFGPYCNFQCHCLDNCDMTTGECIGDRGCDMGYFGPSCQYYSVAFKGTTTQLNSESDSSFAVDGHDTTCSATRPIFNPLWSVTFSDPAWVVWTDILFPINQGTDEVYVFVVYGNETPHICNASMAWITSTLLRVTCKEAYNATSLSILGTSSKQVCLQLCEVYVSGGRNLAIHKHTNQSSEYNTGLYRSSLAVDGDTSVSQRSCTHTDDNGDNCPRYSGTKDPWWRLYLDGNYLLYRVMVYNRKTSVDRLTDFRLRVRRSHTGAYSHIYRDRSRPAKEVTSVQMPANQTGYTLEVRLRGQCRILTLCEVQVFGDCLDLRYGLDCNSICSCRDPSEVCNKIDGRCLSGCADGITGIDCKQDCLDLRYGLDCNSICSCRDPSEVCNKIDGRCLSGCADGITGIDCKQECPPGTFGRTCSGTCSENCVGKICSHVDGTCNCQPGWKGDNCTIQCPPGTFGRTCSGICSENCVDRVCNNVDGTCNCQPGWKGDNCTIHCLDLRYGLDCNSICSCRDPSEVCNKIDGRCLSGCADGITGIDCKQECPPGTFGRTCSGTCNENCVGKICSNVDGTCNCQPGWKGDNCTIPCDREHYGDNCIGVCSSRHCDGGSTCSPSTGLCDGGCQTGWAGPDCTVSSGWVSLIVPVVAGTAMFVVLVLAIVAVIVWRKKRSGRSLANSALYITASNRQRSTDETHGVGSSDSYPNGGNVQRPDAEESTYTTIDPQNLEDQGNRDSQDTNGYEIPMMYRTYEKLNTTTCEPDSTSVYTGLESTDSEKQEPEYQNC